MCGKFILRFVFSLWLTFGENSAFRISNYLKDLPISVNPETYLTPPKIIRRHGYPAESHIIQSEDGYLLEYHRIPHGKSGNTGKDRFPILLHHGLLCSSIDWIVNGPDNSLAFRLADAGYDVWMANARGNTFSRSHISYSPKDMEFWNYSFHEMGIYDIPAALDYILNVTSRENLVFIGHSLGTTTFYAFATSRPDYSHKILAHISVAPVGAIPHTTSAFRYLVPVAKEIRSMSDWYNNGAFLEHDLLTSLLCKYMCGTHMFDMNICEQLVIFNLFGKDAQQFNETILPVVTSNLPAGTSGKNMIHCSQLIARGDFAHYDYGAAENLKLYNSSQPPLYDFSKISIPVKMYYGKNDILADPLDVQLLYQKMPKPMGLTLIDYDKWSHVDFLWAIDVNKYFNDQLLEFVANLTQNGTDFIMTTVEEALVERSGNAIPIDIPFKEPDFMSNFTKNVAAMPNMIKTKVEAGIENIKHEVSGKVEQANKVVKESVERTQRAMSDTKNAVNNQLKVAAKKWNDAVGKLVVFSHVIYSN